MWLSRTSARRPPPRTQRRQVATLWIGWRRLAVSAVAVPPATVLVGDRSPPPVRQWIGHRVGPKPNLLGGIDQSLGDHAQMRPVVTEIEHVQELLPKLEHRQLRRPKRQHRLVIPVRIRIGHPRRARLERRTRFEQVELMQVCSIPSSERVIDRHRQPLERVLLRRCKDPARSWPQRRAPALDQLHRDRQPRPTRSHTAIVPNTRRSVGHTDAHHHVSSCREALSSGDSHATPPGSTDDWRLVHPKMDNPMDMPSPAHCKHHVLTGLSRCPRQDSNLRTRFRKSDRMGVVWSSPVVFGLLSYGCRVVESTSGTTDVPCRGWAIGWATRRVGCRAARASAPNSTALRRRRCR